jgi:hypothetical protein
MVIVSEPVMASEVAFTTTLPGRIVVTRPDGLTVAKAVFDVLNVTVLPESVFPWASFTAALTWTVPPARTLD